MDCSDNSDEMECKYTYIDKKTYNKERAPLNKFGIGDRRLEVWLNISDLRITNIDYVKSKFNARFTLTMDWLDDRITFLNLLSSVANILPTHEVSDLWVPSLRFQLTPDVRTTIRDSVMVTSVLPGKGAVLEDLTRLHEETIFPGLQAPISATRMYNEEFACVFDLEWFPFDNQICRFFLGLVPQQTEMVKLMPECRWPISTSSAEVGEFSLTKVEVSPRSDRNGTDLVVEIHITRSFWRLFSSTYLPTFCLLILVQMTFYFPEDNFQVRQYLTHGYSYLSI